MLPLGRALTTLPEEPEGRDAVRPPAARKGFSATSTFTLLFLLGVTALTFSDLLSGERIPLFRDLLFFVIPFKTFLREHLLRGQIPLWNPFVYMGTPFLASLQTGVFYPPSVLLLLPFPLGFNSFVFAHYLIAVVGAYALFRDRGLSRAPTAIGSMTFALGGYLVSMLNLTNHLQAGVWVPWALLFWSRFLEGGSLRAFVPFVVVLSLQFLGGAPETLAMTLAVLASWTAYRQLPRWSAVARSEAAFGLAVALMAGITAFQSLPTAEYVRESIRAEALAVDDVTAWSLEPVSLLQLLLPQSPFLTTDPDSGNLAPSFEKTSPWIQSFYLGLVPLCFAILGLCWGRERRFWGAVVLAGVVLALGKHTPVFPGLFAMAPDVLGKFRYPEKFYFLVHLGAAVLVAEGAEQIVRRNSRSERMALIVIACFLFAGGSLWAIRWVAPVLFLQIVSVLRGVYAPLTAAVDLAYDVSFKAQRLVLILGTFGAMVLLARSKRITQTIFVVSLVGLVAADLASTHHSTNLSVSWSKLHSEPLLVDPVELRSSRHRIFNYQTVSDSLPGRKGVGPVNGLDQWWQVFYATQNFLDVYSKLWQALYMDVGMVYGVGTVSGAEGIVRKSEAVLRNILMIVPRESAIRLLGTYSVSHLMGPVPLESALLEGLPAPVSSPHYVYRVRHPLALAYLASRVRVAETQADAFSALIAPDFEPGVDAVVDHLPNGWVEGGDGDGGTVTIVQYEADRVRLRVDTKAPSLLVLNDSYFSGWEASVDGRTAEIVRTNALVRGISVPQGTHDVVFAYRPRSFRVGAIVSLASLMTVLALAAAAFRTRSNLDRPVEYSG